MDRIDEIRARCEAATPGEWRTPPTFSGICSQNGDILAINRIVNPRAADMIFIAYAREDIPFLLDELAAKDADLQRYKQLDADGRLVELPCLVNGRSVLTRHSHTGKLITVRHDTRVEAEAAIARQEETE